MPVTGTCSVFTVMLKLCIKALPLAKALFTDACTCTVPVAVVFRVLPPVMVAPVVPALRTLQVMGRFASCIGAKLPVSVRGTATVAVVGTPVIEVTMLCKPGAVPLPPVPPVAVTFAGGDVIERLAGLPVTFG
jgi:hypothetical protein